MKTCPGGFTTLVGLLAAAVLLPISSAAVTRRDDVPDSNYLSLAAGVNYAPVGQFVNGGGYTGSATLITPDWVLTAGHNLIGSGSGTFTLNGIPYASSQVFFNPGWNGDPFHGFDFGLVHLSTPVAGVTPATLYPGSSEFGQVGTYVGFGFKGTGLTGYQTVDLQKRAFQNMIDGNFGNPSLVYGSDFDNPHSAADNGFGDPTPLTLEGCVAPGDSGGGVFLTDGSRVYLTGVISFVASIDGNSNSDYGDASGFGRISSALPWITSTIPEPSVSALLGAGVGLFVARRGRRLNK